MRKKNPARAGWPRRLALVRLTLRAEVDVIGVQQFLIAWAIFPSKAPFRSSCSLPLIIVDNSPHMHNTGFFPDCCLLSVTNGSSSTPYLARYSEIFKKPNFQAVVWHPNISVSSQICHLVRDRTSMVFLRLDIPFSPFLPNLFLIPDKVLCVFRWSRSHISWFDAPIPVRSEIGRWIKSDLRKSEKGTGKKDPAEKQHPRKRQNPWKSGPTPVARSGSGAKAPPLAARPNGSPNSSEKCSPRRNWKMKDSVWLRSLVRLPSLLTVAVCQIVLVVLVSLLFLHLHLCTPPQTRSLKESR